MSVKKSHTDILFALSAALLYALSTPLSKLLLEKIPPMMTAGFLYLGAGIGMLLPTVMKKRFGRGDEKPLTKKDLPYTAAMVILDIAAPILLMLGLSTAAAANVSLLNNFEIVATSFIAMVFFREKVSKRLLLAILLVTAACVLLTVGEEGSFSFSFGSVFVLLACICWGVENNCTRNLSQKDPMEIVVIKGFGSGVGALIVAFISGERLIELAYIPLVLLLGFVSYGLSITLYIRAQRTLGASKTSTYYAAAPFMGVLFSFIILGEKPGVLFFIALAVMAYGTYLVATDRQQA